MSIVRRSIIASVILAASAVGPTLAVAAPIKVVCFLPARSISVSKVLVPWMKTVEQEAAGEVKFEGYWGGSLGRSPKKQYDLMRGGIADIAYVVAGYTPGQFPDFGMFQLPYLIRSAEEGSVAIQRMHAKGMIRGLEEGQVIGFFSTDPNSIHTNKPFRTLADLKGLKLRTAGAVYSSTVRHFGGIPIGMPVTQMTESISRGVVDGTLLGWGGALIFRLHNVTSYHYVAALGIAPLFVSMNKSNPAYP